MIDREKIEKCAAMLSIKGLSVAFAESATAGRLCMEFSQCKDAGRFFKGGIVCYDTAIKEALLHVPKFLIDAHTPESPAVTYTITTGLIPLISADLYIGITGLTSPGGSETLDKPVGTMFFCGILNGNKIFDDCRVFYGASEEIILAAIDHQVDLIINYLNMNGQIHGQ